MPKLASASRTPKNANHNFATLISDQATRKEKNARAQADFRDRRTSYISTLEATVTQLEFAMLELQQSIREARAEAEELRQDNARLLHALGGQNLWQATQPREFGHGPDTDDPPLSYPHHATNTHLASSQVPHYGSDNMLYHLRDDHTMCGSQYIASNPPSLAYVEYDASADSSQAHAAMYNSYLNPVSPSLRDGSWSQTMGQALLGEQGLPPNNSHLAGSLHFAGSPTIMSPDRSISPSSSTCPSSSSATFIPPFQFNFPENSPSCDPADFDYCRQGKAMLHGGMADISHAHGHASDAVCYGLGTNRTHSGIDRPLLPILSPLSVRNNGSPDEGHNEDSGSYPSSRLRSRRGTPLPRSSRSPSPGSAQSPLSTITVIKVQAFGMQPKTRKHTQQSSDEAIQIANEVLEACGIGMGIPTPPKWPRLSDNVDLDS
ncbi:hypothetical protein IW261DRAFT_1568536 [Armillaria novae-zelandiae]|uniref:BZIP domain-containing protein n=1 Tax=Armillaria novae-zelandiae TaxID=153914 RepID=A0AA39NZS2_9AGAR|nr:hypothetical protein IW261DRAFT_1568536 [Armillaria novae-zelandiae]